MSFIGYLKILFVYRLFGWNGVLSPFIFCLSLGALFIDTKKSIRTIVIYLVSVLCLSFLNIIIGYLISFSSYAANVLLTRFFTPAVLCLVNALFYIFQKRDWYTLCITSLAFLTCSALSNEMTNIIGEIFGLWDSALALTFFFAILSLIVCKFLIPKTQEIPDIPHFTLQVVIDIAALVAAGAVEYVFNMGYRDRIPVPLLLVSIGIYFVTICSYVLYSKVTRDKERAIESQGLFFKKHNGEALAKLTEENIEDIRKIRHDLKAQYQLMQYFLEKKDYKKLQEYFAEMTHDNFLPLHFLDCGNDTISGVVNVEMKKAQGKGFLIHHEIAVPKTLSLSDYDLSHLLFNLLDNAIEAVERERPKDKTIGLSIFLKNDYLFIQVKNGIDGRNRGRKGDTTSKNDKIFHGYGLKIIKQIVKKDNGIYTKTATDDEYRVEIGIPCHEKKEVPL